MNTGGDTAFPFTGPPRSGSRCATALYEVYGIWNVCTAAGVTDASEAFARVMVGELCFMILLLVLPFKTETKTVP